MTFESKAGAYECKIAAVKTVPAAQAQVPSGTSALWMPGSVDRSGLFLKEELPSCGFMSGAEC